VNMTRAVELSAPSCLGLCYSPPTLSSPANRGEGVAPHGAEQTQSEGCATGSPSASRSAYSGGPAAFACDRSAAVLSYIKGGKMFRRADRGKAPPVRCRACGANNSSGAKVCRRCAAVLEPPGRRGAAFESAPPQPKEVPKTAHKFCSHATPFPPLGKRIQHHEVWCTALDKAVPVNEAGPEECFCPAFTWKATESLD
jgi:hypothetical protein